MQSPEEFCRKIDLKLRQSVIITLAFVFAAACAASILIYIFSSADDFLAFAFSGGKIRRADNDSFLMTTAQSDGTEAFSLVSSELSDGIFSAVILGKNCGDKDIVLKTDDFSFYVTDVRNGGKPQICCVNMCGDIVICSGCETEFSISANVPQDFSYDGCKASVVFSASDRGKYFGLMLN